jgi:hypothetical protein
MPVLVCKRVKFCSKQDELLLFEWLKRIRAVRKVEGTRDSIVLHVGRRISGSSLRELLALFYRYGIDMKQLAQFLTERNNSWFASPTAFWYKAVFGRTGLTMSRVDRMGVREANS